MTKRKGAIGKSRKTKRSRTNPTNSEVANVSDNINSNSNNLEIVVGFDNAAVEPDIRDVSDKIQSPLLEKISDSRKGDSPERVGSIACGNAPNVNMISSQAISINDDENAIQENLDCVSCNDGSDYSDYDIFGRPIDKTLQRIRRTSKKKIVQKVVEDDGKWFDSDNEISVRPQRIMKNVVNPFSRIVSSAWLQDPKVNAGASTSTAHQLGSVETSVHDENDNHHEHIIQEDDDMVSSHIPDENIFVKPRRKRRRHFVGRIPKKRQSRGRVVEDTSDTAEQVSVNNEISQPTISSDIVDEEIQQISEIVDVRVDNIIYPLAWCGMDELSSDEIDLHSCSEFNNICPSCKAKYFQEEKNTRNKYVNCCNNGKVALPSLGDYRQLLKNLMEETHTDASNFQRFIRKYNDVLSFTSIKVETDNPPGRDPYVLRMHGRMYHRISNCMRPAGSGRPRYSQLYVYDAEEALRERMHMNTNRDLKRNLLRDLDLLIRDLNPFAQSYKLMKDIEQEVLQNNGRDAVKNICMWFTTAKPSMHIHQGRQNQPIATDVAMMFRSDSGVPPPSTFCVFPKGAGIKEIFREHAYCDSLSYTIIFPNGEI